MNYFCSIYDDEEWVRQVYEDKVAQTIKRVAIKSGPAAKKSGMNLFSNIYESANFM